MIFSATASTEVFGSTKSKVIGSFGFVKDEKMRMYGTEEGLVSCIDFTDLYDNKDVDCLNCINKRECHAIKNGGVQRVRKQKADS